MLGEDSFRDMGRLVKNRKKLNGQTLIKKTAKEISYSDAALKLFMFK